MFAVPAFAQSTSGKGWLIQSQTQPNQGWYFRLHYNTEAEAKSAIQTDYCKTGLYAVYAVKLISPAGTETVYRCSNPSVPAPKEAPPKSNYDPDANKWLVYSQAKEGGPWAVPRSVGNEENAISRAKASCSRKYGVFNYAAKYATPVPRKETVMLCSTVVLGVASPNSASASASEGWKVYYRERATGIWTDMTANTDSTSTERARAKAERACTWKDQSTGLKRYGAGKYVSPDGSETVIDCDAMGQTSGAGAVIEEIPTALKITAPGEAPQTAPLTEKKSGVIRIGLAGVKTLAVGEGMSAAELSSAVRNTLIDFLKVPSLEIIPLDAKLTTLVISEAKQKNCDYVLLIDVSHKKGGGGFGGVLGKVGTVISNTGLGNTGSAAGNVAVATANKALITATTLSANIKAKDEVSLEVRMNKIDGTPYVNKSFNLKAKSNGEDIISKVVEQAANEIATVIN